MSLLVMAVFAASGVSCITTGSSAGNATSTVAPTPVITPTVTPQAPPRLEIDVRVSRQDPAVGEELTVTTDAGGAGLAQYRLTVNGRHVSTLDHQGGTVFADDTNHALQLIEAQADRESAEWRLLVNSEGHHEINVTVTGEVGITPDGPWFFTIGEENVEVFARQP